MTTECNCRRCQVLCERTPGWFLPSEAMAALAAGHARSMMRDWLEPDGKAGTDERIYVLSPAVCGHGGDDAPEPDSPFDYVLKDWVAGTCVFLRNGLCDLHTSGFKPVQCRTAFGCRQKNPEYQDKYAVARAWQTDEGRAALAQWQQEVA